MKLIDADRLVNETDDRYTLNEIGRRERDDIVNALEFAPTVDAVPVRHGNWIRDEFGARCGACGLYAYRDKFDQPWESPYCPMCGARMGERKEE